MRRLHTADRRSRHLGTTALFWPVPHRTQKTFTIVVLGRHTNNFAEHT